MLSWFRRRPLEEKSGTSGIAQPEQWLLDMFAGGGTATEAGENVGPESALKVPAVLAAFRTIAETMASLNVHLYRRGADGSRERERDHPAAKALERPAPWMDAYPFKLRLIGDAIRHGRGLAVAARGGDRIELHLIQPNTMAVEHDVFGEPSYKLQVGEIRRSYAWSDVVDLVPIPNGNGQPLSILGSCREAIGLLLTLQRHGSRLFRNGARPSGLLSINDKLNGIEIANYKKLWEHAHGGRRAGGTAVMDRDAKFIPLVMNSVDAQFAELWRLLILEIARAFRVPPHMLAELERATHMNAEEQGLQFVSYCLRPWSDLMEGALTRVLLTEEERDTYFLETNFDDLTRGDIKSRVEALQKAIGGPFLTANEGRAIENRGPIEGGDKLNQPQGVAAPTPRDAADYEADATRPAPPLKVVA